MDIFYRFYRSDKHYSCEVFGKSILNKGSILRSTFTIRKINKKYIIRYRGFNYLEADTFRQARYIIEKTIQNFKWEPTFLKNEIIYPSKFYINPNKMDTIAPAKEIKFLLLDTSEEIQKFRETFPDMSIPDFCEITLINDSRHRFIKTGYALKLMWDNKKITDIKFAPSVDINICYKINELLQEI